MVILPENEESGYKGMSWAAEELKTASLGDKRRNKRLIKIVEDLSGSSPGGELPVGSSP